jgi:hypothetical protein
MSGSWFPHLRGRGVLATSQFVKVQWKMLSKVLKMCVHPRTHCEMHFWLTESRKPSVDMCTCPQTMCPGSWAQEQFPHSLSLSLLFCEMGQ